jgi:hypothetical protein
MILLVLWDGHLARPLYFWAGRMPTPQELSLFYAMSELRINLLMVVLLYRYWRQILRVV